jgi:hypothetical protein
VTPLEIDLVSLAIENNIDTVMPISSPIHCNFNSIAESVKAVPGNYVKETTRRKIMVTPKAT